MSAILNIDLASAVPAYRQVVDGLRALLVSGQLAPGQKLPPVRQLASDLTVHHNTVAEAYRVLAGEGWLDLRRGRGATVLARQAPQAAPQDEQRLERRFRELSAEAVAGGMRRRQVARMLGRLADELLRQRGEP